MRIIVAAGLLVFMVSGSASVKAQTLDAALQHVFVYKTTKDYRQLVPVILSDNNDSVISYPDPQVIKKRGSTAFPTPMRGGYLMNNTPIGEHMAFLDITYKDYAKLKEPPTPEKLYGMIKDKNPLTYLCDCGIRQFYDNAKLNISSFIAKKQLHKKCKVIKE